jgi:hypothetical protein
MVFEETLYSKMRPHVFNGRSSTCQSDSRGFEKVDTTSVLTIASTSRIVHRTSLPLTTRHLQVLVHPQAHGRHARSRRSWRRTPLDA